MPEYTPSFVNAIYGPSANPPKLDKIVFTIDHVHMGGAKVYSTYDVVKFLVRNKIPVTIFMECTDPANSCHVDKLHVKEIYELDPDLVTLGIHALPKGSNQEDQSARLRLINDMIVELTGSPTVILSYHGAGAGPETGIVYNNVKYARGIKSWTSAHRPNKLDTPVMSLRSIESSFRYTRLRNKAGLSATLFIHSVELNNVLPQKRILDTFVAQVKMQKLQALDYYSAMEADFTDNFTCPLTHFTNEQLSQNLYLGYVDGLFDVYQVQELQHFLIDLGFYLGISDGIYGNKTSMAVLMFQVEMGLEGNGKVGSETRKSINAYCDS